LPHEARFGIIETRLAAKDVTAQIARDIRPHLALVTNIEAADLSLFPTLEAKADAAAQLFAGMDSHGIAVLGNQQPHYARLLAAARTQGLRSVFSFGEDSRADARLLNVVADEAGSQVDCSLQGVRLSFRLSAPGRHLVQDALAALLACAALGVDITLCAETLEYFRLPQKRGTRQNLTWGDGTLTLIDESAEASPASLKAAIAVLGQAPAGRRIAVLGDMENLGTTSSGLHAALAESLVENGIDSVHCCGQMMTHLHDALPGAMRGMLKTDSTELAPLLAAELRGGDTVMVKGSRGMQMDRITQAILAAAQGDRAQT
jgi:UDP-N-acetylmuramoyl-tripeptide--D-alanyl-D-alanine ligase